ncbi:MULTISPECIES: glycosyltransferase family 117 protein [unclassified Carboxylicivirga]|uniref:glycosyltransferase family 117 protein n=1 Tax=Carboxylicivirga TaxID=1628153 RepID=UPI003D340A76
MTPQKRINQLVGWTLFLLSAFLYWNTMAPTVSLWDCGEFIACMAKLEVGHPPGAPLYLILGRIFTLFATTQANIAYSANLLSVMASAATVMLLYFSAEHILRYSFQKYTTSIGQYILIVAPSAIAAMAFAASDTFWFSAVEAEVYALSVFFTALCFWLFLKWDEQDQKEIPSSKWLILIAYFMGLSVGVHLLNLLIIPVLVLLILLRRHAFSWVRFAQALVIGGGILALILFVIIQNGLWLASHLELFMVNSLGLPFNSGLLLFVLLLFGTLFYMVFKTRIKNNWQHLAAVITLVFMIGYSSYALIIIRADANPPINLNAPSDVFSLDSFLNREQYAQAPLLYGQYFNTPGGDLQYKTTYRRNKEGYEPYRKADEYAYETSGKGLFPRMHSSNPSHKYGYQQWAGANINSTEKPAFITNLRFFFNYQINHMYFRYLMWNFAGRQNDEQGHGELHKGNWISGIPFIDKKLEGQHPHSSYLHNPSRNTYFLLPFLLGLLGILFFARGSHNRKKYLAITALLFLMTGPAIILYLNQTPFEPRERDYAFVGSFFAFALFIAYGAFGIVHLLWQKTKSLPTTGLGILLLAVAVPLLMLSQNYNDHNRAGRTLALNQARSYLDACDSNAILFTYGDNDTYPLWYVQEVEDYRTDIRVINYGLMGADWCIRQLSKAVNETAGVPLSIDLQRYKTGDLDYALLLEQSNEYAPLKNVVRFIASNDEDSKLPLQNGKKIDYSPIRQFALPYNDKDTLKWECPKKVLYKNDIALLDILASNNWERPIYFTTGADPDIFLGLQEHLRYDGPVYKLVPQRNTGNNPIYYNCDSLLNIFLHKVNLGDATQGYYDHYCRRTFEVMKYRQMSVLLANDLLAQGRKPEAIQVITKSMKELPLDAAPDNDGNIELLQLAHECGQPNVDADANMLLQRHLNNLLWYASLPRKQQQYANNTFAREVQKGQSIKNLLKSIDNTALSDQLKIVYRQLDLPL